ncbi:alpha/beta hydrolase [Rhizobium sp. S152]|uniref:alpha/beta fold hydrolase n=1 Tax=Rhizobium sp. S152 TaxID=3055038 RepID=UPI0025A9A6C3|nr:alpha/beta hydrolase [Rhizobium sp. S152]MDM9625190.1 alpha/beta hydrolase [Rhizobium sp. S152]
MTTPTPSFNADAAATFYVEAGDNRIAYRVMGPERVPPLVLAMRFRGVMDEWDPAFLDALATTRRVYWFDSAGVGLSSGEVPDSIPGMARVLISFVEALELGAVDLLGWSMGGYVVQSATLQRPDLVRRLVVAGSGPGGVPDAPKPSDRVWQAAGRPVNDDADFLYLFFPETEEGIAAGRRHLARLGKRNEPAEMRVDEAGVKAMIAAFAKFRAEDAIYPQLERLSVPVLYANGTNDVMIHAFNSYAAALAAPNAQLILYPRAGHGFLFQHVAAFVRDLTNFLDADHGIEG